MCMYVYMYVCMFVRPLTNSGVQSVEPISMKLVMAGLHKSLLAYLDFDVVRLVWRSLCTTT
jgi:hypothetical protein